MHGFRRESQVYVHFIKKIMAKNRKHLATDIKNVIGDMRNEGQITGDC